MAMRFRGVLLMSLLLCGCSAGRHDAGCPPVSDAVTSQVGEPFVAGLTLRLAGSDRENAISEAVAEIHRKAPSLDADEVADVLIAADCPNAAKGEGGDPAATESRLAEIRAQVLAVLGGQ